jgi:hypothetical protein
MDTALDILGAFVIIDLAGGLGLLGLVWLIQRRGNNPSPEKLPVSALVGAMILLGVACALVYGGIWLLLRASQ